MPPFLASGVRTFLLRVSAVVLPAVAALAAPVRAVNLPPGFVVDSATPGAGLDFTTCFRFLPDGRMLVLEKRGRLWVFKNGVKNAVPTWSAENEVLDNGDRGALGLAVDPDFVNNRWIYLLYTVDPDSDGVDTNDDAFGRLVRYRMGTPADSNVVDPASRTILLGVDWTHGPLVASTTHTIGTVRFGRDGSLLVSTGEGGQFTTADGGGMDPNAFGPGRTDPSEDIGAFRAQYLNSLCGKILRLDPATGHGYPSNPFWDGDPTSVRSRVWAYGLRNPFRFTIRPGTGSTNPAAGQPGTLYIGDVGWGEVEELNVAATGGLNFGWPCWEGLEPRTDYQALTPAHAGCATIGTPENPSTVTWPTAWWDHGNPANSNPPGAIGRTSIGGAFYTGSLYPPAYQGRYFQVEFTFNWFKALEMSGANQLVSSLDFADQAGGPVAMETDPVNGDLLYAVIYPGDVRRIRFTGSSGGNTPPVAAAGADVVAGVAPLHVSFSSAGSFDPDGGPLAYAWTFGDGQGSSLPNPTHDYVLPGAYEAVLSVADTSGAIDTAAVAITVTQDFPFPTTGVLDDFGRPDGPLGGAWAGATSGFAILDSTCVVNAADASITWGGAVFGPEQEAYVTFAAPPGAAGERDLMLKVQGPAWSDGHIEVRYDPAEGRVTLNTYEPGVGWVARGGPWPVVFAAGDRFGARARADGAVEVFRNGARIATGSVGDWSFAALGGRLGFDLASASGTVFDDFGGGDATLAYPHPPVATILAPVDSAFYAAGDTIRLHCTASDPDQAATTLAYRWDVDLHHNVHVHPGIEIVTDSTGSFVAENHDDGSGVWLEIRLAVTDSTGLADTARVSIFPEIDLEPGAAWTQPPTLGTGNAATFRFWLRNHGRMPAPYSRWRLSADGATTLAEGDTLVPALDSVLVTASVPPLLAAGTHLVRVTADTLAGVVETDEANNGAVSTVTVIAGTTGLADGPPAALRLSSAFPNPASGAVSWTLELPVPSRVAWTVHDVAGREVWRSPAAARGAGRWTLQWDGTTGAGAPAPAGVYLLRVRTDGATWTRRFARVR